tara:strand:+ start:370 stop:606 length:237 start_codon:yes stop_codon:yes gene_type:complete
LAQASIEPLIERTTIVLARVLIVSAGYFELGRLFGMEKECATVDFALDAASVADFSLLVMRTAKLVRVRVIYLVPVID